MNANRLQYALTGFNRAIELYPSDAQAHNNSGSAKFRLGDLEGARVDFQRALELEPGMGEADENLKRLLDPGGGSSRMLVGVVRFPH